MSVQNFTIQGSAIQSYLRGVQNRVGGQPIWDNVLNKVAVFYKRLPLDFVLAELSSTGNNTNIYTFKLKIYPFLRNKSGLSQESDTVVKNWQSYLP